MQKMAAERERQCDRPVGREEVLRVSRGLASSHAPLSLAVGRWEFSARLVRWLYGRWWTPGQHLMLGRTIAHQLIGDDDPRYGHQSLEECTKELPHGGPITLASDLELRM
jgi:hypothetical protein